MTHRTPARSYDLASAGDPEAVTARVAALTDAENQQVLQYLAGFKLGDGGHGDQCRQGAATSPGSAMTTGCTCGTPGCGASHPYRRRPTY